MTFEPTHVVPQGGLPAWNAPDGSQPPAATLAPGTELQFVEQRGAWAHVAASNGWRGWVNAAFLVARGGVPAPYAAPAPGGWVPPQQGTYYAPRTNGMAIASLVLGILWLYWVGSILAVIFGSIAKNQIDQSRGAESGRGMAVAGIVLGWIGIGTLTLVILIAAIAASSS